MTARSDDSDEDPPDTIPDFLCSDADPDPSDAAPDTERRPR